MSADLYLLLGYPGTGKYTVAKALAEELERRGQVAKVVDAHYVNNPVFGLIQQDGRTPLDPGIWGTITRIREAVLETIELFSPVTWSFVFTNFITTKEMTGGTATYIETLERIAIARGSRLHFVRLTCEVDELCRRIALPERSLRMKSIDADWVRRLADEEVLYQPEGPVLTLDVTELAPGEAALQILAQARAPARQ